MACCGSATAFPNRETCGSPACRTSRPRYCGACGCSDPLKAKHLQKALVSLAEEGVTQLFRPLIGADFIVGAVGPLQLEVMADRLSGEYGLDVAFEDAPFAEARWLVGPREATERLIAARGTAIARDVDDALVFLAKSAWEIGYVREQFAEVRLAATRERA